MINISLCIYNVGQIKASRLNCIPHCDRKRNAWTGFTRFWTAWHINSQEIHVKQSWAKSQRICLGTWQEDQEPYISWRHSADPTNCWGRPQRTSFSLPETKDGKLLGSYLLAQSEFRFHRGINRAWHKRDTIYPSVPAISDDFSTAKERVSNLACAVQQDFWEIAYFPHLYHDSTPGLVWQVYSCRAVLLHTDW